MNGVILCLVAFAADSITGSTVDHHLDLEHCSRTSGRSTNRIDVNQFKECPKQPEYGFDFLKPHHVYTRLDQIHGQSCVQSVQRFESAADPGEISAVFVKFLQIGVWVELLGSRNATGIEYTRDVPIEMNEIQMGAQGKPSLQSMYNASFIANVGSPAKWVKYVRFADTRTVRLDCATDATTELTTPSTTESTINTTPTITTTALGTTHYYTEDSDMLTYPQNTAPVFSPTAPPTIESSTASQPTPPATTKPPQTRNHSWLLFWIIFMVILTVILGIFVLLFVLCQRDTRPSVERYPTKDSPAAIIRTLPHLMTQKSYTGQTIIVSVMFQQPLRQ